MVAGTRGKSGTGVSSSQEMTTAELGANGRVRNRPDYGTSSNRRMPQLGISSSVQNHTQTLHKIEADDSRERSKSHQEALQQLAA